MRLRSLLTGGALLVVSCGEAPVATPQFSLTLTDAWDPPSGPVYAGLPVTPAPRVRVVDAAGRPRAGARVMVVLVKGNASTETPSVLTDADGYASIRWELQPIAATNEMRTYLAGATDGSFLTFTVDAVGAAPSRVDLAFGTANVAIGASAPATVTLRDVRGVVVTASEPLLFTSTNEAVATISATGVLTGQAAGSTDIIVSHGALQDTVRMLVRNPAPTISASSFAASIAYGIAFTPTRRALLADPTSPGLARFNAVTLSSASRIANDRPYIDVAVSPDSTHALLASYSDAFLVELELPTTVSRTIALPGIPLRVRYAPAGDFAYVTMATGGVAKVTLATGAVTSLALAGAPFNGIELSSDGSALFVSAQGGNVYRIDAVTFAVVATSGVGLVPQGLSLDVDESRLFVARGEGALVVLSSATLAQVASSTSAANAFDVVRSPDGKYLFVLRTAADAVAVLDALTLHPFQSLGWGRPRRAAIEPSTGAVWITSSDGDLYRISY